MATTISKLNVQLSCNASAFASAMYGAAKPVAALGSQVATVGSKVAALGTALGGGALLTGVTGLGTYALKLAADAEQARVSFTTMLGSAEKAKELQAQINQFAASTPFQTTELIDASKKLLAFGVAQDQVIPTMRTLGDLAAGLGVPLADLSELYGKAKVQGRLMAEDINQLTGRGIPVIGQLAKQFGVAEGEVKKLVEQGKIGFPHLQKALLDLTADGGQFGGMMAAQSKTVAGLFSTLQDTVTLSLTRIGETMTEKLDLRSALGGMGETIGILADAALPVLEAFIGRMTEGGNIGQRAGQLVLDAAQMIATGLAYAADYSKLVVGGFRGMQAGAAYAIGGILVGIDYLGSGLVKLLNLLPGVELQWTETIGAMGQGVLEEASRLSDAAGQAFDDFGKANSAKKVGQFFDDVRANAAQAKAATEGVGEAATAAAMKIEQAAATQNAKVTETLEKLRKQIDEFGFDKVESVARALDDAGATDDQIAEAMGLQMELDALEQAKKRAEDLQQKAKSVFESVQTPMEKFTSREAELSDMLNAGAIDWTTYGRAIQAARAELEKAAEADAPKAPDLFLAGSSAAQRFAYDNTRGMQRMTRDEIAKKQVQEQQVTNRILTRVEQKLGPAVTAEDDVPVFDY